MWKRRKLRRVLGGSHARYTWLPKSKRRLLTVCMAKKLAVVIFAYRNSGFWCTHSTLLHPLRWEEMLLLVKEGSEVVQLVAWKTSTSEARWQASWRAKFVFELSGEGVGTSVVEIEIL